MRTLSALGWLLMVGLGGCAHTMIEGTQIPDTDENQEVIAVLKQAREALEQRDAAALLQLVSTQYFEDNGTPDPRDDYGYAELRDRLVKDCLESTKEMYITFEVHEIGIRESYAFADIRYATRARLDLPAGHLWDTHRDFDRIEMVREDGQWRIISGL